MLVTLASDGILVELLVKQYRGYLESTPPPQPLRGTDWDFPSPFSEYTGSLYTETGFPMRWRNNLVRIVWLCKNISGRNDCKDVCRPSRIAPIPIITECFGRNGRYSVSLSCCRTRFKGNSVLYKCPDLVGWPYPKCRRSLHRAQKKTKLKMLVLSSVAQALHNPGKAWRARATLDATWILFHTYDTQEKDITVKLILSPGFKKLARDLLHPLRKMERKLFRVLYRY